ncbi:hypothetical protein L7F22_043699 [Adiantum nelumboides]|nr:hypothetical protein [Adiantum nelumboides]
MDEEALRAMMPMSFGRVQRPVKKNQQALASNDNNDLDQANFSEQIAKVSTPPAEDDLDEDGLTAEEREANRIAMEEAKNRGTSDDDDDDDKDDSDDGVDLGPEPEGPNINTALPLEQKVELKDHTKAISALSIDPAGARIATGSYDYDVKLWDFGGMSQSFKPFKTFEPFESYLVHDLAWSPGGDSLLVATGTAQANLYDRDGLHIATYKKGDVYIRDMKNTSGHVAELTSCFWHPNEANIFATTSADSTVRIWDAEETQKQKNVVVVKSKDRGTRTKVTCGAFSNDGKMLAAGCLDGALHIWSTSGTYSRPNSTIELAHEHDTTTSSVCFSKDGRTLASRGGDGTVKLWDIRSFKKPLAQQGGLYNSYGQTNVIFSPDETAIMTGTSILRSDTQDGSMGKVVKSGGIEVLSRLDLKPIRHIPIEQDTPSSVIRLEWHTRINQLFASTSSGTVHLFYSPEKSSRGALLCVGKRAKARPREIDEYELGEMQIITPAAIDPNERGQGMSQMAKKRKMEKMRQDPVASRMPERPLDGPGRGGRIGAAATQHMVQSIYKENTRAEDPREALLKYADVAEKDPQWTAMYKQTQPKPIFRQQEEDEDD